MTGLFTPWHIVLILFLALLLFGAKRLPEIGKSLGSSMREFKDAVSGNDEPDSAPAELPPSQPAETPTRASAPREHDTV
jgi:sec-independent protein translocase protein TatA